MSKSQEFHELHQQLEKWKSHNEVYARPADSELYAFLKKLLDLAEGVEVVEPIQITQNESISSFDPGSDDDPPGGNNPGAPNIP